MVQISSNELAEDYKSSLEDLTFNSKWEISNLTVIARENIQAAQAIARTIEEHINKTSPTRKLPALYLLDSISKNVGTPYTLFFQRNLYQTFMSAYTMVDMPVRRKLEEMLHTWKQPVPGSTSPQPVFAPEMTRKIDNALIKAKTAALQNEQLKKQKERNMRGPMNRNTPPPPQFRNTPPPAIVNGTPQGFDYMRSATGTPSEQNGRHTPVNPPASVAPQLPFQVPPQLAGLANYGNSGVDTSLHSDITRLIETSQKACLADPLNVELGKRLKALVDLSNILQTQQLPDAQLAQVREQVRKIANPTPPPAPVVAPPPPPPQPALVQFSTQDLAALLASTAGGQQLPLPPATAPTPLTLPVSLPPPLPQPPVAPPASVPPMQNPIALFESLKQFGLLPGAGTPMSALPLAPTAPTAAGPARFDLAALAGGMRGNVMTPPPPAAAAPSAPSNMNTHLIDVELKTASLKIPRPHLIKMLDSTLPNKCSSCASRFEDSPRGRTEKAAHLDWHFRVHQAMADSVKRGQNRSWYVGEEEWIHSRGDREDTATLHAGHELAPASSETAAAAAEQAAARRSYVVVPDTSETARVCPICQEELPYVWHHETDEFVWMDATQVGGRIYHASCMADASRDKKDGGGGGGGEDGGAGTPGKRKLDEAAEEDRDGRNVKIKREPL